MDLGCERINLNLDQKRETWQVQEKRSKRDFSVAASNIANTKQLHYSLLKLMENYFLQPFEKLKLNVQAF